ncbi:MAG: aldolase/citrate lyase family protein [Planctomycetota bacterium]
MELVQKLQQKIKAGQPVFGTFLTELDATGIIASMGRCGLDYYVIDTEHGIHDPSRVRQMIDAGKFFNICPFVRAAGVERGLITGLLDAGAEGIIFPQVRTIDEVRKAVEFTKYAPVGSRGVHLLRPHTGFVVPDDTLHFFEQSNRSLVTAIQIETKTAADIIDQIAAINGVDMLYVGPSDLGMDLSCAGQITQPAIREIAAKVVNVCKRESKIAGYHVNDLGELTELRKLGFTFFGYCDALRIFTEGLQNLIGRIHG